MINLWANDARSESACRAGGASVADDAMIAGGALVVFGTEVPLDGSLPALLYDMCGI